MRDDEMIKRIQSGDPLALNEIISAYYNEIYHFLCRKLSDTYTAQDVTQTVFMKFAGNIHTYRERGKLRNYLFKLAANAGNDYFRTAKNDVPLEDCYDLQSDITPLEEMLEKQEAAEAVKNALRELPAFQRDVIILRFYHDLPFNEIARIMDSKVSSAKSRYRQGMDKLKVLLERTYGDE